jgi:integrase
VTVYQDKRGKDRRWRYAFMYRGIRYTGSAPAGDNTQRAAKHEERAHLDRLRAGLSVKTSPTVAEFVVDFLAYQATECRPLTVENQTIHLMQHVVPKLGKVRLDAVTKLHLDELKVMWSRAGAAPRTINTRLDTLRRMLSIAEEWGRIGAIPVVKAVRVDDDHPRFLTEPEAAALIRETSDDWRAMVVVALRTGLRVGELRGLQWGDVEARQIHVRRTDAGRPDLPPNGPKSGKPRTVPLTGDAIDALTSWRPASVEPRTWVWPAMAWRGRAPEANRPRSATGCTNALRGAVDAAGISERPDGSDRVGWHTLRHTYASWLVMRGVSLRVVQALLGHASITQTERYAHLAPNAVHHAAVASLDFALVEAAMPALTTGVDDE